MPSIGLSKIVERETPQNPYIPSPSDGGGLGIEESLYKRIGYKAFDLLESTLRRCKSVR
jgi:hypothetical protein